MLKIALLAVVLVVLIFLAVVAMLPAEFSITRSLVIKAPASRIFPEVNELAKWHAWSPWAKLDPNAKESFEGPAAGPGAVMRWDGNMQVGAGSMTIVEAISDDHIVLRLDFLKPLKGTNEAQFTFAPNGDSTTVTWSMQGRNSFVGKAMSLIFNCEKIVGGQFEQGLEGLKTIAEAK